MDSQEPTIEEGVTVMVAALHRAKDPYSRVSRLFAQTGKLRHAVFAPILCQLWGLDRQHFNLKSSCRTYEDLVIQMMIHRSIMVPTGNDPYRTFQVGTLPEVPK